MTPSTSTIHQPPRALENVVECFRIVRNTGGEQLAVSVCPTGRPGMVFQGHQGQPSLEMIKTSDGRTVQLPLLSITGQITKQSTVYLRESASTVHVVLKPTGIRTLFGVAAQSLTNCSATLESLCPADNVAAELASDLMAAETDEQRLSLLTAFLMDRLAHQRSPDLLVEEAVQRIDRDIRRLSLVDLVRGLEVSERQLERRFLQAVGIPPKQYVRIRRVNEALRLMATGRFEALTDVAYALNYFDQSHFIKDVREFSGTNPRSLTQTVRDFRHDRVGTSFLVE